MICPYCGRESSDVWKEHFFPQDLRSSDWDFYACKTCNNLKRSNIVYPMDYVFKSYPVGFSFEKFKTLWQESSYRKYLKIVPAHCAREAFDNGRWMNTSMMFNVEERLFYGLDKVKEMYDWCVDLMERDPNIQALVLRYGGYSWYLLHTYPREFKTPFKDLVTISVYTFTGAKMKGAVVLGSGKNFVWETTSSYQKYFRDLMSAPSAMEMLKYKINVR